MKTYTISFILFLIFSSQLFSQSHSSYDINCNLWKIDNDYSSSNSSEPDLFTWQFMQTSTTSQITEIFLINELKGWATHTGNGGTWTSNGGINWTNNIFNDTNFTTLYNGIFFINENTGWEVGGALQIRKTTNGGLNWFKQFAPPAAGVFNNVYFFNENTGIAIGRKTAAFNSFIARTTNSGVNWTEIVASTSSNNELSDQYWFGTDTGWLCGRDVLLKTTNGGLNYSNYYANIPPTSNNANALLAITFVNQQTGWIGASNLDNKNIYITTNSGLNWIFQNNPVASYTYVQINDVKFMSADSGWAIHGTPLSGAIMFTTNAGTNWIIEEGSSNWFDCFAYYQRQVAWCGASGGRIWYTSPLIVTGINNNNNGIVKEYKLHQNYPNPFNPVTRIKFDIAPPLNPHLMKEGTARSSGVVLKIYNILGKEIKALVNEHINPGKYEVEWNAAGFPSGVYFYKLTAGEFSEVKKMVLVK